ncbi:MAG: hypothetical protein ACPKQO_00930 [Nitrososphaeraceae archaeon]
MTMKQIMRHINKNEIKYYSLLNNVFVYDSITNDIFLQLKKKLSNKYNLISKQLQPGMIDLFAFDVLEGKITVTYYNNQKLMIQGKENIHEIKYIKNFLEYEFKYVRSDKVLNEENVDRILKFENIVGCDESGVSETFGSMFLACVFIPKKHYELINNIIGAKNIRKLRQKQITELINSIRKKFEYRIKIITPLEIDNNNKISLIDLGYIDIINNLMKNKENKKHSIILDDYGIGHEMRKFSKKFSALGHEFKAEPNADEHYLACKVASLIARNARINEIEQINKKYLLNLEDGNILYPGTGAVNREDTAKYLIEFRKANRYAEFPSFVRTKWSNVRKIEEEYPKLENHSF